MSTRNGFVKGASINKNAPSPSEAHVLAPLTNISVAYVQRQDSFIATQAFPIVPVAKDSDLYYLYDKGDFLRDEAKERAPATESAGGSFGLSTAQYLCKVEAFHKDIDDRLRANADSVLRIEQAAAEYAIQKLLIRRERRWMTNFFGTGIWGTDVTGVASAPSAGQFLRWDAASSSPLADVEVGKRAILAATGFEPNTLILGYEVFSALRNNAAIRDQFKYTSAESINEAMMARYFGVERLLVSKGVYANSAEGATTTTTLIAGKHALLCYSAPAPSIMTPTAGYTFEWTGLLGGGLQVSRYRMDLKKADRIEVEMAYDFRRVAAEMGYFFNGAVA